MAMIIDCDTGRDDTLCLWLTSSLGHSLTAAATSYGNTILEDTTRNTADVLNFSDQKAVKIFPVAQGPSAPHTLTDKIVSPRQAKSGNGLCNVTFPHPENIDIHPDLSVRKSTFLNFLNSLKTIDYHIIGPATNFYHLYTSLGLQMKSHISSVTMLGGKMGPMWDRDPVPDFNIACDPLAVSELLGCGIDTYILPINETWDVCLHQDRIAALNPISKIAHKAKEIMLAYCHNFSPDGIFRFHDPCILFAQSDLLVHEPACLEIISDQNHLHFGQLIKSSGQKKHTLLHIPDDNKKKIIDIILTNLGFV